MAQTSSINLNFKTSTVAELLDVLSGRERTAQKLRRQLLASLPDTFFKEGSDLWWEKEILLGEEEIKGGRYKTYKNVKDLLEDLHKGI